MAKRKRPMCGVLSGGLDGFIRACPPGFATWGHIRRPNSGLREERSRISSRACATDFGWASPLSVARRDGRVDFKQRCPNTARNAAASRPAIAKLTGGSMKTITSRRSLLKNSAATVAALGLGGKLVRAQDAPIRIGVIYDLSGPFAAAGSVPCAIGAQIAIDIVNERGGVAGKYKVQPINADSQSKADAAINEVERLINQEKVENRARRLCERARGAARRQGRGAEEDSLDHHGDRNLGVQGPKPSIRVPRPDPLRPIWPGVRRVPRGKRQGEARARAEGCEGRDRPRGWALWGGGGAGDEAIRQGARPADRAAGRLFGERA